MLDPMQHAMLLAQTSRLESLSRGFRAHRTRVDAGDIYLVLFVLSCCLMAIWGLSLLAKLQERRPFAAHSPLALFLALCKAHRLRWSDRWLLWRVAHARRLRDPARLFVEPELLEPEGLRATLRTETARLKQLSERLYAAVEEPEEEALAGDAPPEKQPKTEPGRPIFSGTRPGKTPLPPISGPPGLDILPWLPSSEPADTPYESAPREP